MPRTFTLLRTLGRGAHGAVHLAEVRDEEDYVQTLAVKRLLPQWSDDADLVARLKDEARLLALLRHDHVVRVHGLTRIEGALAILMEPVDGVDLGTLVEQVGHLPPRVALQVVEAVADALDAAWCTVPPGQRGPLHVVHRDIKPSNVMVTPRGGVKVMDFGVARASFDSREVETRSQQYGTARYMAPERWLQGEAVHASDVFALGITLCEVATGRQVPRPRLSPELFASDLSEAVRGLPPDLAELVGAMTAFAPEARPAAAEVAERCRVLLAIAEGPSLRVWAATHVRPSEGLPLDPTATGTVVAEEASTREPAGPVAAPRAPGDLGPRPRTPGRGSRERAPGGIVPAWLPVVVVFALLVVPVARRVGALPAEGQLEGRPPGAGAAPPATQAPKASDPRTSSAERGLGGPLPLSGPAGAAEPDGSRAGAPVAALLEPPRREAPPPASAPPTPRTERPAPTLAEAPRDPDPSRREADAPAPAPLVVPEAAPAPVATVPVRFTLDPGLVAQIHSRTVAKSPQVLDLPASRTLEVRVDEGGERWTCQITTGDVGLTEVRVRGVAEGGCSQ